LNYLLVEPKVKSIAPNIALMKWATWCRNNGHRFEYAFGTEKGEFVPDHILMSCVFTYYSKIYEETIDTYSNRFPGVPIRVGGVFPSLYPEWFEKEKWSGEPFYGGTVVSVHKGIVPEIESLTPTYLTDKVTLYASRGCTNKCSYCVVPKLEGDMRSFKSIKHMLPSNKQSFRSVVLYDNNFTEHKYFDTIVDELKAYGLPVDIHGLHVDSFDDHKAYKLSQLKWGGQGKNPTPYLRFSFDKLSYITKLECALELMIKYKIKAEMFAYMLFNYNDTPDDFWHRIELAQSLVDQYGKTIYLFPQRYEPITALERNKFIGKYWTEDMVRNLVQMYSKTRGFIAITKSCNIYNLIGHSKKQFLSKIKGV